MVSRPPESLLQPFIHQTGIFYVSRECLSNSPRLFPKLLPKHRSSCPPRLDRFLPPSLQNTTLTRTAQTNPCKMFTVRVSELFLCCQTLAALEVRVMSCGPRSAIRPWESDRALSHLPRPSCYIVSSCLQHNNNFVFIEAD